MLDPFSLCEGVNTERVIMKKTTRDHDLAELEAHRDNAPDLETKKKRTALLENVYQQMKDPTLEKLRVKLIDALKREDINEIHEIRKKVQAYGSQKSFIENIHKKMKSVSQDQAKIYVAKK